LDFCKHSFWPRCRSRPQHSSQICGTKVGGAQVGTCEVGSSEVLIESACEITSEWAHACGADSVIEVELTGKAYGNVAGKLACNVAGWTEDHIAGACEADIADQFDVGLAFEPER
jgi:hypothetical protein